jgi:hypothetical protein
MDPVTSTPTPQQALSNYTPQVDASKYIRTFAKDVAKVTNTPVPEIPAAAPKVEQSISPSSFSSAATSTTTEDGVTVQEFDSSPTNNSEGNSSKEFKQEAVNLTASDSEGIFTGSSYPLSDASTAPSTFVPPAPAPIPPTPLFRPEPALEPEPAISKPYTPPTPVVENIAPLAVETPIASTFPPSPLEETEAEKEAVLARLRAKLASHQQEQVRPAISELPIRAAAPDFSTTPEPTLPQIPIVTPRSFAAPTPTPAPAAPSTSGLHTYSGDFAEHIDSQKSSTFAVLAAQSDAGQNSTPLSKKKRSLLPLAAGVAMLVIGIGAVSGAYILTHKSNSSGVTATNIPSLIRYDESVEVNGTGQTLMKALSDTAQSGSVSGNVVVTYVTGADATSTTGIPQQGGVLIKALSLPAPDILLRNIDITSTVGTIHAGAESRPFFILKVGSYERTFAGMLAWEQTIASDLSQLYPAYASIPDTASSTTSAIVVPHTPVFTDGVVANYNVRVLRDDSGRSILLYGYRGKDTLIIARDEAAFTALISRLTSAGN